MVNKDGASHLQGIISTNFESAPERDFLLTLPATSGQRRGESVIISAQVKRFSGATDNLNEICGESAQSFAEFVQGPPMQICSCIHGRLQTTI